MDDLAFLEKETTGDDLDSTKTAFERNAGHGMYTQEERVVVWLRRAHAALDAAKAIPGISKWSKTKGLTAEENNAAKLKHNHAHRAVEYSIGLLRHTEFRGRLTDDQRREAGALLAEAEQVRGYQ